MTDSIRVLIVDDHLVVRKGVVALLETEADIVVVGEATNGAEAISAAAQMQPDVILMDLVMPQVDGITAIEQILAQQPGIRILVLTSFAADEKVFPAIRAGALGYIMKDAGAGELLAAIRQVQRGEPSLPPLIARRVLHELAQPPTRPPTTDPLTEREVDVLRRLAGGASNKEISTLLGISEVTVRKHVSNILSKLHLASRTQAALYAVREGLGPPEGNEGF
jgi:NarL family two-component system response regulator LiaR